MSALKDRRGWISRAPMWRSRRVLVAGGVCMLVAGGVCVARAAPFPAAVLLVGSYQGIPGQYSSIQAAVDAARPGDWVLIGPGDYHETGNRVPPGAAGDITAGAAVLVTTPNIWIRGMDRNGVVLDGTKPGAPPCSSAPADQNLGPLDTNGRPDGAKRPGRVQGLRCQRREPDRLQLHRGRPHPRRRDLVRRRRLDRRPADRKLARRVPVGDLDLQRRPGPVPPSTGSTPPTPSGRGCSLRCTRTTWPTPRSTSAPARTATRSSTTPMPRTRTKVTREPTPAGA